MASELGAYYITIMPSLQGAKKQIESQLSGVDATKVGNGLGKQLSSGVIKGMSFEAVGVKFKEIGSQISGVGDTLTEKITKPFLVGAGVVTAAAAAIGGAALGAYATWEQAVGGVDTLFKDASGSVKKYADEAYKTAGLSANDYMNTVTSFSASLISSLGGDTAAAADLANQAVTDMSDNANKMGTSMESIMMTYQSLARGNYAMLDNLKLGYGGTKQELERLMSDAEKLSGVKYDPSNFADVISAIHVVQDELGITGTTALEASETIEGSVASMKSAWTNWLTELGKDDADISGLTTKLTDSVVVAFRNIVPRAQQIFKGLWESLPVLFDGAMAALPEKFQGLADLIVKGDFTGKLREAFGWNEDSPIVAKILHIRDTIVGLFNIVAKGDFTANLRRAFNIEEDSPITKMLMLVHENLDKIILGAVAAGPALKILGGAFSFIGTAVAGLDTLVGWVSKLAPLFAGASGGAGGLLGTFTKFLGPIGLVVTALIGAWNASSEFRDGITQLGRTLMGTFQTIAAAVMPAIDSIMAAIQPIFRMIGDLLGKLATTFTPIIARIGTMIAGLVTKIAPVIAQVVTAAGGLIEALMPFVDFVIAQMMPVINGILSVVQTVFGAIQPIIQGAMTVIQGIIQTVTSLIKGDWSGVWEGIKTVFGGVWDTIKATVTGAIDVVKSVISNGIDLVKNWWSQGWNNVVDFVKTIPQRIMDGIAYLGELGARMGAFVLKAKDAAVEKFTELVNWVKDVPNKIINALGSVGSLLWDAGSRIISGFFDGLKSKFEEVKNFVGGIGDWIAAHKGPKAYDLALLIPAGNWIMQGLDEGLDAGFRKVQDRVSGFGTQLEASFGGANFALGALAPIGSQGPQVEQNFYATSHDPQSASEYFAQRQRDDLGVL